METSCSAIPLSNVQITSIQSEKKRPSEMEEWKNERVLFDQTHKKKLQKMLRSFFVSGEWTAGGGRVSQSSGEDSCANT